MTGQNPARFGILGPISARDEQSLPKDTVTIAELLRGRGYATAIMGKWHLGHQPSNRPKQHGFDRTYGQLEGEIDKYTHRYENGDRTWHRNDQFIDEDGHSEDLITRETIRYLKSERDLSKPFFLYVPFGHAHFPLQEEERWIDPYKDIIKNTSRRLYAASVAHMDDNIGRLLTTMTDEQLLDNTLVIFFSDNGGQRVKNFGSSGDYGGKFPDYDALGFNRPFRGWKFELYEGGIRVPAIFYWRGKLNHAQVTQKIIVNDFYPTLASLAGISPPAKANIEGINIWPYVTGRAANIERTFYWKTRNAIAIRKGDWKLIHHGASLNEGRNELFNLVIDPYENQDLAQVNAQKVSELLADLQKYVTRYLAVVSEQ